jgi:hypothetical protein
VEFRLAGSDDAARLAHAGDVFDDPVDLALTAEFLADRASDDAYSAAFSNTAEPLAAVRPGSSPTTGTLRRAGCTPRRAAARRRARS